MSDLIDRAAAIEELEEKYFSFGIYREQRAASLCIEAIKNLPSAKRTGRWIDDELICKARCSVCGEEWSWMDNDMDRFLFCPSCGARMEEQE